MLRNGCKKRLQVLSVLDRQQPVIHLQMQHIQQLSGFAVHGDGLEVLVGFQQVMQRHPVATQCFDRLCASRHKHGVKGH